jgi:hypothetical protein
VLFFTWRWSKRRASNGTSAMMITRAAAAAAAASDEWMDGAGQDMLLTLLLR